MYDFSAPVAASSSPGPDFDIRVTAPGAVWLRTRDANIEIELDVTVRSVAGVTYYLGELKARRGHYYFLGRDFAIDRAIITLTGTSKPDPIIDLSASRVVRGSGVGNDDIIRINVTGSMKRPDIELVYETTAGEGVLPASQDEILKLLVLDMTKRDYDALAGGSAVAGRETDYLGRYAEAEVARAVRRGTGLDVFQFESNVLPGMAGDPYAEFTVGQQLSKDVFVSYTGKYRENALGARSLAHAAEIDYELTHNLFVVGSTYDDEGLQRYGLGLRFIHKY